MNSDMSTNQEFLRSQKGIIYLAQTICSIVGGIVNSYSGGSAFGVFSFTFWATFLVLVSLILTYICNPAGFVESRADLFNKIELCYIVVGGLLYAVGIIVSLFGFGMSAIFAYVIFGLIVADAFLRYRAYKTQSPPNVTADTPGVPKF